MFEAYLKDPEKIDNVQLIVRICQTKDFRIAEKISETTNKQTPVVSRDLHANDRIQKQLEEEFRILNYFYERKKNQYADKPKSQRLDSELMGQLYLAYYLDVPSEAKNSKFLVFGNKYDDIFNEEKTTAKKMLLPYQIYLPLEGQKKEIQKKKRSRVPINERDAYISRATYHILNSVKLIAEKARGSTYTHDKFFKQIETNKIIRDHILMHYPENGQVKRGTPDTLWSEV